MGLPTYAELVKYAQQKQQTQEHEQNLSNEIVREEDIQDIQDIHTINSEDVNEQNISAEELKQLLIKEKKEKEMLLKEKNDLLQEKQTLLGDNVKLKQQMDVLMKKITEKKDKEKDDKVPIHVLQKVFTAGQIKLLTSSNTNTRIKWSAEDITSAIALRSISPKAYRYLRNVKKMPLPCMSTLNNWGATFNIPPGILTDVLHIMKEKGQNLCTEDKLTVLTFDELYISNKIDLHRKEQKIYESNKTCQFVMARGLFNKWKQPIYYEFDKPMSAHTLLTIINNLYEVQYIVVAVTNDMGPTNMKLWNELNIGINVNTQKHNIQETIQKQHFIEHPADSSLKIYFFADVPHLLKLARNNLFDSGFTINGNNINKTCLEELLTLNAGELKIAHKLSQAHLDVKGSQRQNVKLAAQVFSNTNAIAIRWCGEQGLLKSVQWKQTADILLIFNDWFDLFNSKCKYGRSNTSHAYGMNLEEQNTILDNMDDFIQAMRVGKRLALLQFQKGIILCNKSLRDMFVYIKEQHSSEARPIQYLFTNRLNQDLLENMFSYLRMMGAGYDHPTPVELRNRLKWYILGKHSGYTIASGTNTAGDSSTILTNIDDTPCKLTNAQCVLQDTCMVDEEEEEEEEERLMNFEQICNEREAEAMDTDIEEEETSEAINLSNYIPNLQELALLDVFEQKTAMDLIEKNALVYIAGYVAHRFRNIYSHLGVPTKTLPHIPTDWLSFISRGNCMYPSSDFLKAADIMNIEFENFHGNFFNRGSNIFDKLTDIVCTKLNNNFPTKVIACLVRTRTYIRLRKINKEIVANNYLKKKCNKTYKICNKKNI